MTSLSNQLVHWMRRPKIRKKLESLERSTQTDHHLLMARGRVSTNSPRWEPLRYVLKLTFKATNNQLEYNALITGLRPAKGLGAASLRAYCDSQLVPSQVKGEYILKGEKMKIYLKEAKALAEQFEDFHIEAIPS